MVPALLAIPTEPHLNPASPTLPSLLHAPDPAPKRTQPREPWLGVIFPQRPLQRSAPKPSPPSPPPVQPLVACCVSRPLLLLALGASSLSFRSLVPFPSFPLRIPSIRHPSFFLSASPSTSPRRPSSPPRRRRRAPRTSTSRDSPTRRPTSASIPRCRCTTNPSSDLCAPGHAAGQVAPGQASPRPRPPNARPVMTREREIPTPRR